MAHYLQEGVKEFSPSKVIPDSWTQNPVGFAVANWYAAQWAGVAFVTGMASSALELATAPATVIRNFSQAFDERVRLLRASGSSEEGAVATALLATAGESVGLTQLWEAINAQDGMTGKPLNTIERIERAAQGGLALGLSIFGLALSVARVGNFIRLKWPCKKGPPPGAKAPGARPVGETTTGEGTKPTTGAGAASGAEGPKPAGSAAAPDGAPSIPGYLTGTTPETGYWLDDIFGKKRNGNGKHGGEGGKPQAPGPVRNGKAHTNGKLSTGPKDRKTFVQESMPPDEALVGTEQKKAGATGAIDDGKGVPAEDAIKNGGVKEGTDVRDVIDPERPSGRAEGGGSTGVAERGVAETTPEAGRPGRGGGRETIGRGEGGGEKPGGELRAGETGLTGTSTEWIRPPGWRLPKNGEWSGTPGDSMFYPDDPAAVGLKPREGVPFRKGYPDFSKWQKGQPFDVEGMTGDHGVDMPKIHEAVAQRMGLPNKTAAKQWLSKQGLTPHHAGGKRVELIPFDLHDGIRHTGGAWELRNE